MIRLNLLPQRETQGLAHRRRFWYLLIAGLGSVILLIGITETVLSASLERQKARNAYLQQAIAKRDQQARRLVTVKQQHQAALERRDWLAALQVRRGETARLLEQLARLTPDGLYLRELKQQEGRFTLSGYAIAATGVSGLLFALDESDAFAAPQLIEQKSAVVDALPVSEFVLTVGLHRAEETRP
ncbi:PilN domain-containing protein [Neisseriaceae bacterium JH1-16]|nr:PilN domain-containing protein [Neisseriaceae bacterium JH1-16]